MGTPRKAAFWRTERKHQKRLREKGKYGAPGEIRTPDLMLRRHPLYPAELRARSSRILRWSGWEMRAGCGGDAGDLRGTGAATTADGLRSGGIPGAGERAKVRA